jgi:hypothetical protein
MFGTGVPPNRRRWWSLLAWHHVPVDEPLRVSSQIFVGVEGSLQHVARDVLGRSLGGRWSIGR